MVWGPWRGQLASWLATYKGNYNKYYHRNATVAFAVGDKSGADVSPVKMNFNTWRTNYANDPSNTNKNNEANSTWGDPGPLSGTPGFTNTFDPTPPSLPAGLAATPVSSNQINLSWTASTDNVGVAGYRSPGEEPRLPFPPQTHTPIPAYLLPPLTATLSLLMMRQVITRCKQV